MQGAVFMSEDGARLARGGRKAPAPWGGGTGAARCKHRAESGLIKPVEHALNRGHGVPVRQLGAVDHHHRQAQCAGGVQLGLGPGATGVLADHPVDGVFGEKRCVPVNGERPTRNDHGVMRQGGGRFGRINEAQDIRVLGVGGESLHMQTTKGEHDPLCRAIQSGNSALYVGHMVPAVARLRRPGRAGQGQKRYAALRTGMKGIPAHLRGKGVCGVNDMADVMVRNVAGQPLDTAKAANPMRDRLRARGIDTARVGKRGLNLALCEGPRKGAGFGRAAKNKEVGTHV